MKEEEEKRPSTCSADLRPGSDLSGRAGEESGLEPAISSWYQRSKSSLEKGGLLLSHWYWRASRRAKETGRKKKKKHTSKDKSRLAALRGGAGRGETFVLDALKSCNYGVFRHWKWFLNTFNTLLLSAALCPAPSGCFIPVLHVSILILQGGWCSGDPVSRKNIKVSIPFWCFTLTTEHAENREPRLFVLLLLSHLYLSLSF